MRFVGLRLLSCVCIVVFSKLVDLELMSSTGVVIRFWVYNVSSEVIERIWVLACIFFVWKLDPKVGRAQ